MKMRSKRIVALLVIMSMALTACGTPAATPATQESESTTTTTTEATTTTTTTTESTTTTTTAEASTTTTTTKTSTTSQTTYPKGHPNYKDNPAYKDKNAAPGKEKQQFLFRLNGEDVVFMFEKAMRDPYYDDCLLWHYTGTTKDGIVYTCIVAAEQNQIWKIRCAENGNAADVTEATAQAYTKQFIVDHGLSLSLNDVSVRNSPLDHITLWSVFFPMEQKGDHFNFSLTVGKNGAVRISDLEAEFTETVEGQVNSHPYCLGEVYPLLVPRWISEPLPVTTTAETTTTTKDTFHNFTTHIR